MLSYFPITVLLVIPHDFILPVFCLSHHILCTVSRNRGSGLRWTTRGNIHTCLGNLIPNGFCLFVGNEICICFTDNFLAGILKSHQIRSAQSNNWLWAVFSGKLAKLFWATLCGHRMFIQISLMCYEREISFNNLLMCQIFTFESSRVVNSGWPVCWYQG